MKTFLILMPFLLALSACSFNSDSNSQEQKRDADDRAKLTRTYSAIQGVYAGTIEFDDHSNTPANLIITFREDVVGKDSQGQPRYRPVLVARLNRPNLLVLDTRLEGNYVEESGDLTFTSPKDKDGNSSEGISIHSALRGGVYEAPINWRGARYGLLHVELTGQSVPDETQSDILQIRRIRAYLNTLTGIYNALVTPTQVSAGYDVQPFQPTFRLYVDDTGSVPALYLSWRRTEFELPLAIPVDLRTTLNPREISFRSPNGSLERFVFFGTFTNGVVDGTITYPTFTGNLHAVMAPNNLQPQPPEVRPTPAPTPNPAPSPTPKPKPKPKPSPTPKGKRS